MAVSQTNYPVSEHGHRRIPEIGGAGYCALKLPVGKDNADGDVLFTVPTGYRFAVKRLFWEVTTGFTGGASSAVGVSSSNSSYSTAGDLLGGATGDVTATLGTAGIKGGTLGTKFGSNGVVVLEAGDTIKFNKITSAFTAGAGYVHVELAPVG